jgi:hypothetical protein
MGYRVGKITKICWWHGPTALFREHQFLCIVFTVLRCDALTGWLAKPHDVSCLPRHSFDQRMRCSYIIRFHHRHHKISHKATSLTSYFQKVLSPYQWVVMKCFLIYVYSPRVQPRYLRMSYILPIFYRSCLEIFTAVWLNTSTNNHLLILLNFFCKKECLTDIQKPLLNSVM